MKKQIGDLYVFDTDDGFNRAIIVSSKLSLFFWVVSQDGYDALIQFGNSKYRGSGWIKI